ncbi:MULTISPECIES: DUF3500 domain-containing protein [Streptomyces]|uniref:Uncharacterized protein n=1 Tax=Streptomyces pseudovenezuelae TaxID=67350 RepID=A0A101N094_9ACTN|nr:MULTISPECIES: DUF3500 domain-containing protein [Streptomyces]KUM84167.1 hypothetical protein AQI94_33120 [Streptomyces pseudovenezuelae]
MVITIPPRGISGRDLSQDQRHLLRRLVALYTGRAPEFLADAYDTALDLVRDPRLLIEYDNTQRHANHAHSVWRDLTSDFGLDVLAEHRALSAHE